MKNKYLSLLVITKPTTNANARSESEGNLSNLAYLTFGNTVKTVLTGPAIRYAIREAMGARDPSSDLFRHHNSTTVTGFSFGPDASQTMLDAATKVGSKEALTKYPDLAAFGFMALESKKTPGEDTGESEDAEASFEVKEEKPKKPAKKTEDGKKASKPDQLKFESAVKVTLGMSLTSFAGDCLMDQGTKANVNERTIYNTSTHFTRYMYGVEIDLEILRERNPGAIPRVLNALKELRVGGNQARALAVLHPDVIAWRFHDEAGCHGLYCPELSLPPEAGPSTPVDLTPLRNRALDAGFTFDLCGLGATDIPCAVGLAEIIKKAVE